MRIIRQQINEMIMTNNDRVSNTKFWAFIGSATATWIMIYLTLKDKMTWELFVVYLASVAGFSQLSKFLSYKFGGAPQTAATVATTKCEDCPTEPKKKEKTDEGSD